MTQRRLAAWTERWGNPPAAWVESLATEVTDCADPEMALLNWERWIEAQREPWAAARAGEPCHLLTALFSQSQFLSDILIADPALEEATLRRDHLDEPWSRVRLRAEITAALEGAEPRERRLCVSRWRRRHLLRIGLRDILDLGDVETLTRELASLAEVIVQTALDLVWDELVARWGEPRTEADAPVGLAVIGMGKLGGRELNFSSDIDLIFIYSAEGKTAGREGRVENHRFMARLCERLVEFIGAVEAEGRLYRVDMRLRPEGAVGPLARSLESLQTYFDSQARLWERLAHTKARVVAQRGSDTLADALEAMTRQFCFGTAPGPELAHELAALKHRIDREVAAGPDGVSEVKRGSGGIREIEFVVGFLQLIHGHPESALRVTGFFETLRQLEKLHVLTTAAATRLRRAYETLRRIEHRLQMMNEFQTHSLPADPVALARLARRLGWKDADDDRARRRFLADHTQIASMVHQAFLQHVGAPELGDMAEEIVAVLDEEIPPEQAAAILARFQIGDPAAAVGLVRALGRGGPSAYVDASAQRAFERLLPALLAWCPQVPSADLALRQLAGFVDAYKARGVLYTLMAEQPQLVEVLMRLFGSSELLGRLLIQHPEFFDSVVARALGMTLPSDVLDDVWERLRPRDLADAPRALDALRTVRQMITLSSALRHVLGRDPWRRLARQLTALMEFCLGHAWRAIVGEGADETRGVVCIALGKFGGREINIESDLDVILVAEPPAALDEPDAMEWLHQVTRRCERLVAACNEVTRRGMLFALDTRLRPEGRNAPLVCTAARLADYFAADAQLWEFQSFLRARVVAGDLALGQRVIADVHAAMRSRLGAVALRDEVRTMRARLEENADHPGGEGAVDLKRDPGGIIDAEFITQLAQLEALRDEQTAPEPNTADALRGMKKCVGLGADERRRLRGRLLTLRAMECQLRLLQGSASSSIPADPERWQRLAVAHLGPRATAAEMRSRLSDVMSDIRALHTCALDAPPA